MKKLLFIVMVLGMVLGFIGCAHNDDETMNRPNAMTYEFRGEVESIENQVALVNILEGEEILSSGDKVNVFIGKTGHEQVDVGEQIIVEYDGAVMESYPLQVNEISIRKTDGTDIEIVGSESTGDTGSSEDPVSVSNESYQFEAMVIEILDGGYIVEPVQGSDELKSSDRISISTNQTFKLEDTVIITYDGVIMESYPAQINLISVELKK